MTKEELGANLRAIDCLSRAVQTLEATEKLLQRAANEDLPGAERITAIEDAVEEIEIDVRAQIERMK